MDRGDAAGTDGDEEDGGEDGVGIRAESVVADNAGDSERADEELPRKVEVSTDWNCSEDNPLVVEGDLPCRAVEEDREGACWGPRDRRTNEAEDTFGGPCVEVVAHPTSSPLVEEVRHTSKDLAVDHALSRRALVEAGHENPMEAVPRCQKIPVPPKRGMGSLPANRDKHCQV